MMHADTPTWSAVTWSAVTCYGWREQDVFFAEAGLMSYYTIVITGHGAACVLDHPLLLPSIMLNEASRSCFVSYFQQVVLERK